MSRRNPKISRWSWRTAIISLAMVTSLTIVTALLIAGQGRALSRAWIFNRIDEQWTIRSGRAETDRLVLRPTANSIGLALHPIDSLSFTLQARVEFDSSQGSGGLIVQADDVDHFTAFLISHDGYFRVSDYRNGVWIDRVAWRAWPHIRRAGTANLLRAECGSDRCTFFVNDEWTWQEQAVPVTRWIGVVADGAEARFDQLGMRP
jgi:hypothetical protein